MRNINSFTLLSLCLLLPLLGISQSQFEATTEETLLIEKLDSLLIQEKKDSIILLVNNLEKTLLEQQQNDRYIFLLIQITDSADDRKIKEFSFKNFLIQKLEKSLFSLDLTNNFRVEGHRFLGDQYDFSLNIDLALNHYQKATDIYLECPEEISLSFASTLYTNFSDYYLNIQQLEKGRLLLEKAIEIDKNAKEPNDLYLAIDYLNLAWAYQSIEPNQSVKYFQTARAYFEKKDYLNDPYNYYCYLLLFVQMAETNLLADDPQQALLDINIFFQKLNITLLDDPLVLARAFALKGNIYQRLDKYQLALDHYTNSYNVYRKIIGPHQIIGIHKLLTKTAECYLLLQQPSKALELIDRSFSLIDQSGTPDQCRIDKMLMPDLLFDLYIIQASTFKKFYLTTNNSFYLEEAQRSYNYALEVFEHIKISVGNRESRRIFLRKNFMFFEDAVDLNYVLWTTEQDSTALENIFYFSEKSKNNLLAEGLNEGNNNFTGGVTDSLLKIIRHLDIKITKTENIYLDEDNEEDEALRSRTRDELLELQRQKTLCVSFIEKNYPEYYHLKYQVVVPAIKDVQATLSDQQGVLSYFVSEDFIYIMLIDELEFNVKRIPLDFPLNDLVAQYRTAIINSSGLYTKSTKKDLLIYHQTAFTLYQKIFEPFIRKIPPRITILPDNQLGNLAFDALLTQLPDKDISVRDYSYLMNEYIISYQYSASSILKKDRSITAAPKEFIAFAPKFEDISSSSIVQLRDFGGLFYNDFEVDQLEKIMGGTIIKGHSATEDNFIKLAPDYQIIHLATHGKVNSENADFSYLAFQEIKDSIENELLYVRDIYNLKLKADLVVLSACETASGNFNHGEGITSLSRGFIYAGAAAVLPTLWKISDATTATIMEDFYKELKQQQPKDIALSRVKKKFLHQTDITTAHPFFWAAFTLTGDPSPIQSLSKKTKNSTSKLIWILLACPFIIGVFWWMQRRVAPS